MLTYKDLIKNSKRKLDEPELIRSFLLELLDGEGIDLYQVFEEPASKEIEQCFYEGLNRLIQGEPLAYVLGYRWFYNSKFIVNKNVLIPRSETEELVDNVLRDVNKYFLNPVIIDIATGSGAIAISLAKALDLPVDASDLSSGALEVAKNNAQANHVEVNFFQGDMLEPILKLNKKYNILVSNPPYIKGPEHVGKSVLEFEPHMALFGGEDGLMFYRKIFEDAKYLLKEKSLMAFEIGFDIGDAIVSLANKHFPNSKIELKKDMNGQDRMLFIYQGINQGD